MCWQCQLGVGAAIARPLLNALGTVCNCGLGMSSLRPQQSIKVNNPGDYMHMKKEQGLNR
jgi:hypothetical protein